MMKQLILLITLLFLALTTYAENNTALTEQIFNDQQDKISLSVHYPQFSDKTISPESKEFNQQTFDITQKIIAQFNALASKSTPGTESKLEVKYEVHQLPNSFISVLFTVSSYIGGGAYPNLYHRTLNFNLATGKAIELHELFKPESHYMEILDSYTLSALHAKTHLSKEEIMDSSALNYHNWNLTEKGILITFDDFPHALGELDTTIPYSRLRKVLLYQFT